MLCCFHYQTSPVELRYGAEASWVTSIRNLEAMRRNSRAIEILLIEDNPGDARLTWEALKDGKIQNHLHVQTDGEAALEFLHRRGDHAAAPVPDLILLDLNLPKKDGREVLAAIKEDERLRRIPVVVLTTSDAEEDILRSYELHANCYVTKPVGLEQFLDVVRRIDSFWLEVVKLPPFPETSEPEGVGR
jgi:chemotaxis family two-component system response regulator Rcp1